MFVKQGIQKTKIGVVTSDKMEKSRVVLVERLVKHPLYKKYIRRSSKFMAHDETNDTKTGDKVKIIESKPLSARKRWKIIKVLERAK
jgi:small subunit ribosomal protein S17